MSLPWLTGEGNWLYLILSVFSVRRAEPPIYACMVATNTCADHLKAVDDSAYGPTLPLVLRCYHFHSWIMSDPAGSSTNFGAFCTISNLYTCVLR